VIRNAQALAATLHEKGYRLVSGGTDTHLMLVDLTARGMTGKAAEEALGRAGITVNKNTVPNEQRSPFVTSGIRIGTPALTTRGMGEAEMQQIGEWIDQVLSDIENESVQQKILKDVNELCKRHPLYANLL